MSDIAEKLLKAIEAKEVLALATTSLNWKRHDTHVDSGGHCAVVMNEDSGDQRPLVAWLPTFTFPGWHVPGPWANAEFIADNDPAAVLRRCAADRRIIDRYLKVIEAIETAEYTLTLKVQATVYENTIRDLARGYGLEVDGA